MHDLEQAFRAGLSELADEADVTVPVVARARAGARRRHRRTAVGVSGVAAAVLAVAALSAVLQGRHDDAAGPAGKPIPSSPSVAPSAPGGYRLEFWHDVAVYVPAMWGWGSAPVKGATDAVLLCGGGQVVQEDGSRRVDPGQPYVGRPVPLSSHCDAHWSDERPQAPYVWLGGDVPTGTVDLGGGWVRQTTRVGDVTVSVASDDAAQRRAILASAHRVTGACQPRLGTPATAGGSTSADFVPVSMTVCAYVPSRTQLDYDLVYEQELTMGPAKYLVDAVAHAKPLGSSSCFGASGGEWAMLRLRGNGGAFRDYVVDMSCPSIADPAGTQHELDTETVTSWAVGGVNAVLHGNPLIDTPYRFIPPQD